MDSRQENDPYETRRPWDHWQAQQKEALERLEFTDAWYEREMIKSIRQPCNKSNPDLTES